MSLYDPSRQLLATQLQAIPWLSALQPEEREHVLQHLQVLHIGAGEYVFRSGEAAAYWWGVIDGLLKVHWDVPGVMGLQSMGLPPAAWCGEGYCLKRTPYSFSVQALRKSTMVGLPVESFHWLLSHSMSFNQFVLQQLNERLEQAWAMRDMERYSNPDIKVARCLSALFHPPLRQGAGPVLRLTQQELAQLVGLSRQRVNEALAVLEAHGAIQVEYGGLRVRDAHMLRSSMFAQGRKVEAVMA